MSEETLGHMMIRELHDDNASLRARVAELEAESARHAEVAHIYLLALSRVAQALGLPNDPSVDVETLVDRATTLWDKLVQVRNDNRATTDRLVVLAQRAEKAEAALATARAEERERLAQALLREAASVSMGATFADGGPLSGASRYNVLRYCANKIDELSSPTPEPPHD